MPQHFLEEIHSSNLTSMPGPDVSSNARRSWRSTMLITGTILAGVVVAIAHDRFFHHLDGRLVDEAGMSQSWVSRISVIFAFLFKMTLAVTIKTSYDQSVWFKLRNNAFRLKDVDFLIVAPSSVFTIYNLLLWRRVPILLLMAVLVWSMPIAAVISPGALEVIHNRVSTQKTLQVPQLSYRSDIWSEFGPVNSALAFYGASVPVQRVAYATAMGGNILHVPQLYPNYTYHLDFDGLAIQCSPSTDNDSQKVNRYANQFTGSGGFLMYLSFRNPSILNETEFTNFDPAADRESVDLARIYFYFHNLENSGIVTECFLHNATYHVDFITQNSISSAKIRELTLRDKIPTWDKGMDYGLLNATLSRHFSFQSVMHAFGQLLLGQTHGTGVATDTSTSSWALTNVNWTNAEQTQRDLEILFQNITLSLFSSPDLLLNTTQAAEIPVIVTTYPLIYSYNDQNALRLAYGLGLLGSALSAATALYSIWVNAASYTSSFSTVVRTARCARLEDDLFSVDDDGSDPLPGVIGQAKFQVQTRQVHEASLLQRDID